MPSHVKNYSLLLLLAVLWSGSFAFIKIGVESVGPLTLTWARLSIAAVLLMIWLKLNSIRLPRNLGYWKICAFIGLIGNALPFSLISWGETRIDSGLKAVLMGIMPITTAVLAHIFIKDESFTARTGMGIMVGLGSVAVLVGPAAFEGLSGPLVAQLAVVLSAICYGASTTFTRFFSGHWSGKQIAGGTMICACLWMTPVTFLIESPLTQSITASGWLAIAYLGVGPTAIAMLIFFHLISQLGANRFAQVNYIVPVLGALWGVLFLNEIFSWRLITALTLVVISINIVRPRKKLVRAFKT